MVFNESIVEDADLEWFSELGHAVGHGPHLAPGGQGGAGFVHGVVGVGDGSGNCGRSWLPGAEQKLPG